MQTHMWIAVLLVFATAQNCAFIDPVHIISPGSSIGFDTLETAISAALRLGEPTTIWVARDQFVPAVSVTSSLTIIGCGEVTLNLTGAIQITPSGLLALRNLSLDSVLTSTGLTVQGKLELDSCLVNNWSGPVLSLTDGFLIANRTAFNGCQQGVIYGTGNIQIQLFSTSFTNISGETILAISAETGAVEISDSVFSVNRVKTVAVLKNVILSISRSNFSSNTGSILSANGGMFSVSDCLFVGNKGGIALSQKSGISTVRRCRWESNSQPFLLVSKLQGSVQITDTVFLNQTATAPIQVLNSGSASSCVLSISDSLFANSSFYPVISTAAVIYTVQCSVLIRNTVVHNCTAYAASFSQIYGAIAAIFSIVDL